jgi:serine/threonine-protein kinase RsbW
MASAKPEECDEIEIRIPCKAEYVRTVRRTVADFAESTNMSKQAIAEIEIATSEAVTNIVRHAYPGCDQAEPVLVKCGRHRGRFVLEVTDHGRGFNAPPDGVIPEVDLDREGGFGIILMKRLMDRVNYVSIPHEGTRIRMTKRARDGMVRLSRNRSSGNGRRVKSSS